MTTKESIYCDFVVDCLSDSWRVSAWNKEEECEIVMDIDWYEMVQFIGDCNFGGDPIQGTHYLIQCGRLIEMEFAERYYIEQMGDKI